jgi:hypothetical protein
MRIRRTTLDLYGKARAAVADGHVKDGIQICVFPACRGEILNSQTRVPQPSHSIHKHVPIISTVMMM